MTHIEVHSTRKRLAIIFTIIVFIIAFFLEVTYFSLRYYNISYTEKKEFNQITNQIARQISLNPDFFPLFLSEGIKFRPQMGNEMRPGRGGPERGIKFLNFLVLDKQGNIIAQNFTQDIVIDLDDLGIAYNTLVQSRNGILLKKISLENIDDNFQDLIFLKVQGYNFLDYLEDIFFFLVVNLFFSIFFYYIGLFFVGKNLKPIEQTLEDMNNFIHNANHELKTPISVISSNLQLLKTTKTFEEDLVLDSIKEIKRMDDLISGLSHLSDISILAHTETLDLQSEIQDIVNELKNEISAKNLTVQVEVIKNLKIKSNPQYFYIVFSNLLRNAIKYNYDGGNIKIILSKNILSISNTGVGIASKDLPFIFDRFFQADTSRNGNGFGIGLSLVKKICDTYSRDIQVQSAPAQETIFTITF